MFIAMGDFVRNYVHLAEKKLYKLKTLIPIDICGLIFIIHFLVLDYAPYQILNLGGNTYHIM